MTSSYEPRPLPVEAQMLCEKLGAPARLVNHLVLVYDVSVDLVAGLRRAFPGLELDGEVICFGAAFHDLGKVLHPSELIGPGNKHEDDGPALLESHGVPPHLARVARTHGRWSQEELPLEDLLVCLSDTIWKGQRLEPLEALVVEKIAAAMRNDDWEVFSKLDVLLEEIARMGDERLAWQQRNG